jgi:hypothetical protein
MFLSLFIQTDEDEFDHFTDEDEFEGFDRDIHPSKGKSHEVPDLKIAKVSFQEWLSKKFG